MFNISTSIHLWSRQTDTDTVSILFPRLQLAVAANARCPYWAQTSIIFKALIFFIRPLPTVFLPCVRVHPRSRVKKIPQWRGPPLPPSTWMNPFLSEKVCRRIEDVSFTGLTHLLPGCMTENFFQGCSSYAYGVSSSDAQRTHVGLVIWDHVI